MKTFKSFLGILIFLKALTAASLYGQGYFLFSAGKSQVYDGFSTNGVSTLTSKVKVSFLWAPANTVSPMPIASSPTSGYNGSGNVAYSTSQAWNALLDSPGWNIATNANTSSMVLTNTFSNGAINYLGTSFPVLGTSGGTQYSVMMFGWDGSYATPQAAAAAGAAVGWGAVFQYTSGSSSISIVSSMVGQTQFGVFIPGPGGPLYFTQDLTNFSAFYGQNKTISVSVGGSMPENYIWFFFPTNKSDLAGGYAQITSGSVSSVVITNGGFGYQFSPSVTFTGGNPTVAAAGTAIISNGVVTDVTITNAGSGYLSAPTVVISSPYQTFFAYSGGQTNASFTITNVNEHSLGNYYVRAEYFSSYAISHTVNLTLIYPPSITANPVGYTQNYLSSNSLSVSAAGTPPMSYQWMRNGTNVPGATATNYIIPSLTLAKAGIYLVSVTNVFGSVTSSPAGVYILPTLTSPFSGASVLWGQDTDLNVGAVGSGTLTYQWYLNGEAILGANSSTYQLAGIQFTNQGLYSVVVSSEYGSVTNTAYQVIVNPANVYIGTCPKIYISGTIGYSYTIQSSVNLTDVNSWVTETNIVLTEPIQVWIDAATDTSKPENPRKYYRVVAGQ